LITRNEESPTVKILHFLAESKIVPVYSTEIMDEYKNVLRRPKFHLPEDIIDSVVKESSNTYKAQKVKRDIERNNQPANRERKAAG
jgi:predicted nucleic acid-binding protein